MITLKDLKPYKGSRKRRKIIGRGLGSGHGTYSGRGMKGQKARSGGSIRPGFEGGRMPLIRQTPKRRGKGFKGDRTPQIELDLDVLASHFGNDETVTRATLLERGLVKPGEKIKILNNGSLDERKLTVVGVPLTRSAQKAIEKAGGQVKEEEVVE